MPRQARLFLPGVPLHVTQCGVNRGAIFVDDEDRRHYRRLLRNACQRHAVQVHAFVLMSNHVHLLVTAPTASVLAQAMRNAGQCYVQHFNARHRRCGTLWQGRFKSCMVDDGRHLLNVIRYIELNPVRAAMVAAPQEYRWSSVHTHLGIAHDPLVTQHPAYLSLGDTLAARAVAYGDWLRSAVPLGESVAIRNHLAQEKALGSPRFQEMVARTLNRSAVWMPRGRPRKED